MIFNSTIRTTKDSSSSYHSQKREPPIAVYLGQMLHIKTRKLNIVDKICHLGICISSDCLLNISTALGNSAVEQYEREGIACHP